MRQHFEAILDNTDRGHLWTIVLAGGEGTRLAEVCRQRYGYDRPKQFCSLLDERSLLETTLWRVSSLVPNHRMVVSTTQQWRAEAEECLQDRAGVHRCVQPANAGTLAGLLAALLDVLAVDPGARVIVLPADHYFSNRAGLLAPLLFADRLLVQEPSRVVLLGAQRRQPEPGLGWIVPGSQGVDGLPWRPVQSFVEKPTPKHAAQLLAEGALANTMVVAARAAGLCRMIARHTPTTWGLLTGAWGHSGRMEQAYQQLPGADLARDVLEGERLGLRVLPLVGVHWSDLGVPLRLQAVRERLLAQPIRFPATHHASAP